MLAKPIKYKFIKILFQNIEASVCNFLNFFPKFYQIKTFGGDLAPCAPTTPTPAFVQQQLITCFMNLFLL